MGIVKQAFALKQFVKNDSMSIVLFVLFLVCVAGQGLSGWLAYNKSLESAHFRQIPFWAYLATGNFLDGIFSNWQAAVLQLFVLIAFGAVLRQKGATHSRKMASSNHRTVSWKFGPRPTPREWLYANSLSLAFFGMFAATFLLHALFGELKYNEDQALRHLPPTSFSDYAGSSSFWFSVLQCWEAEFSVIAIYIVLSIFLRQENSPESKPVGAGDEETGHAND